MEVLIFLAAVAVIGLVGVGLGMLVAPYLERLTQDPDEEPSGDERTDD